MIHTIELGTNQTSSIAQIILRSVRRSTCGATGAREMRSFSICPIDLYLRGWPVYLAKSTRQKRTILSEQKRQSNKSRREGDKKCRGTFDSCWSNSRLENPFTEIPCTYSTLWPSYRCQSIKCLLLSRLWRTWRKGALRKSELLDDSRRHYKSAASNFPIFTIIPPPRGKGRVHHTALAEDGGLLSYDVRTPLIESNSVSMVETWDVVS